MTFFGKPMIFLRNNQKGVSTPAALTIVLLIGFFVFSAFKIVPPYYDNRLVVAALKGIAEKHSGDLNGMSKRTVRADLDKFYTLNNVRDIPSSALDVKRTRERTLINVNYEVRIPFLFNIDVVIVFKNQLDSSEPERCCTPREVESEET